MRQQLRILMVEDSEADAELLLSELERAYEVAHTRVQTAEELARALAQTAAQPPAWDLLIADVRLPGFSGIEALEMVRACGWDLPLIIVTGYEDSQMESIAMRSGAHDFFVKDRLSRLIPVIERELREAEERRSRFRAEARFRSLLEAAPDALVIADAEGRIVLANSQAEHLFGYAREELRGESIERLLPARLVERHREHRAAYARSPQARPMGAGLELFARHRDGHEFPVEISLSPLEESEGVLVSSAIRDISERKRAENERRAARLAAEAAAREAQKQSDRIGRLQAISGALAEAITPAEVAAAILKNAVPALEASGGGVAVLSPERDALVMLTAEGYTPEQLEPWRRIPMSVSLPITDTVRLGEPLVIRSQAEFKERYPQHDFVRQDTHAWASVPLILGGEPAGALMLSFLDARAYGIADHDLLLTVGRQCALALERSQLYEDQQRLRAELEDRVQARTAELRATNQTLVNEVAQRRLAQQQLEAVREQERERISREIHDELGSILTVLKMDLAQIRNNHGEPNSALTRDLDNMSAMIDVGVDAARRLASELHPVVLADLGLPAALEWQLQRFVETTGVAYKYEKSENGLRLPEEMATGLFRIVQEALTNIARHAEATEVQVRLLAQDGFIRLWVSDNGRGMPAEQAPSGHMGLVGMRERAEILGADLQIVSPAEGGTSVRLVIPCPR